MTHARAEELVDYHAQLRKHAFAAALTTSQAFFEGARTALSGAKTAGDVANFNRAFLTHLTQP